MKKVLVLVVAMTMLVSGAAFAQISGTGHDLSTLSAATDEICVFCHTPHNAAAVGFAPLWNRGTTAAIETYSGTSSLNSTIDATTVNATDATLCLSCHDGASLTDALNNAPNNAQAAGTDIASNLTGNLNIDTDLSNDHPIGFDYATTQGLDTELRLLATAEGLGVEFFSGAMWCSSCHDVHDDTVNPFLKTSNAGSGLCLACHIK